MKKKPNSIKKNFVYNIIYQILNMLIPLITAPYVSRVIGADGVGTYSYTYSIVQYYLLFILLGVNNYGNRTIAKDRDDKDDLSKNFWNIYSIQFISFIIVSIVYFIYTLKFASDYKLIFTIEYIFLISTCLDINWFFFGLEKFKYTIMKNLGIKILSTISIFIFVKTKYDLNLYILILALSTLLANIVLWKYLIKYVKIKKPNLNEIKTHFKKDIILFIPVLSISIYNVMDKIMIGNFSTVTEVGLYENAEKIINIPLNIITALGTVMLPRISNLSKKGEDKKIREYISKSMQFTIFISIPICLGLAAISRDFAPLFYGVGFKKTGILIEILSVIIIFKCCANVIRTQYLIPNEKDSDYIISVVLGAITNFIINLLLIPKFNSVGACIGTVIAELVVMLYQFYSVRNNFKSLILNKKTFLILLKSICMFIIVISIKQLNLSSFITILLQVTIGVLFYALVNINNILKLKKD